MNSFSSQEDCQGFVHIDSFGAIPNSIVDSSSAIQQAIDYCVVNHLSKVMITGVQFYTISQPIVIKSNVHLFLDPDVILKVNGNFNVFELKKNASISGGTIEIMNKDFQKSVIYVEGSQQIEIDNHTFITNINIVNNTGQYNGIAIHLYCAKAWDFISFLKVSSVQIKNFQTAIYLKTEYITDKETPCWINANTFQSIFIDGCQYGVEIDGNSNLPNEISGNMFTGIQVQCRQQTKKVIRCSGAYNTFDCMIWDTYRMSSPSSVVEFSSISHRNYIYSNIISTAIIDQGQYNVCTSTYEQSLLVSLPVTLDKPHMIGNQDDILVNAHLRYTVKQIAGKAPYGGNINNCFNLIDEQSINYIDVPETTPVVIELDFSKNPIQMLNCFGIYFGWKEAPKNIRIEYLQSTTGKWFVAKDVQFNVGDIVLTHVKANMLYKVRITVSGYIQDHKRFRMNRIFARSSMLNGAAWLSTAGGILYGDVELQFGKGVVLTAPDLSKWRVTINEQGQIVTNLQIKK
ncbi:hypothetical protein [Bacillus multifaciens]|uniref:hypothetical protein n=1 Tax=Bacillus multifaciens TaxID=3068506 RepID=UPI0027419CEE|nr:hypothetical protein [Bacillus sp. WLY-B-L8]MDP7977892.1 hypothetical protein [Bacillus sp. WLY-B-L8]